jgi:hypothetical protein
MVHHLLFGKSDCDARKTDVGSQSADTIKLSFINWCGGSLSSARGEVNWSGSDVRL